MTDIALVTAAKINVVSSILQRSGVANETIVAGAPVRYNTTTGKFTNANASSAAEARVFGIALNSAGDGQAIDVLRLGVLDGYAFGAGTDYDENVWLSDTDGRLADAAGTVPTPVGRCVAGTATTLGTAFDKLLFVDCVTAGATALTSLAISSADGLVVNGVIVPQAIEITVNCLLNTHCVDQAFFTANRAYKVTAIREIHAVAGNDGSAVNLQVTKDTGTNAPGAGTDLLTDNAAAGLDMKGTANTVQTGTLVASAATLSLAAGNRLSLDFAGTVTTLAGLQLTVTLVPV